MVKKLEAELSSSPSGFVNANNEFALKLYSNLKAKDTGNVFFSPYSISSAMAMVYEGAKGATADEIRSVFSFPNNYNDLRGSFKQAYDMINKEGKKYTLNAANALWSEKTYKLLTTYTKPVKKYYGGDLKKLDFISDSESSRKKINRWVENRTNEKIKDLIPQGMITSLTKLVITNAVYFKGTWLTQFDSKNTKKEKFKVSLDESVETDMMSLPRKTYFKYAEAEGLQVLEMPYDGEELSMLVMLPKEGGMKTLEDSLSVERLSALRNSLSGTEIEVYMPKFKFETKCLLANNLKEMGMPTAFADYADFSGMNDSRNIKVSDVVHQAFVDVNEEGTEAAAATGVVFGRTSICLPKRFRADHPFMFTIQENSTGNILFLGRVVNPAG